MTCRQTYNDIIYTVPFYTNGICSKCLYVADLAMKKTNDAVIVNQYSLGQYKKSARSFKNKAKKLYDRLVKEFYTGEFNNTGKSKKTQTSLSEAHIKLLANQNYGRKIKESRLRNYQQTKERLLHAQDIQCQVSKDEASA